MKIRCIEHVDEFGPNERTFWLEVEDIPRELIEEAKLVAQIVVDECIYDGRIEWSSIRNRMRDDISRFLYDRTKRSPMVLPIITSV